MTAIPKRTQEWVLERVLGTGGFGIVELWTEKNTGAKLAIKMCKDVALLTDVQKERWIKEVLIMKRLNHPNIIKGLELPFEHPADKIDLPVLCMQYCKRGDLRKMLNDPKNCCGIKEKHAIKAMRHISSAVEYLHSENITHRDLKPENIVVQEERGVVSYKLIDLGYAKELGEDSTSGSLVGTLNYVAPELLWQRKYNCSVDYWSLGILFYELVTGIRPFLPGMQHTMTWMQLIKNKGYDDICAFKSNGKVVFGQEISSPSNLSKILRGKLVDWFRLVLQWHPKKRGKRLTEDVLSEVLVFKLLNKILSIQMVYVFSMSEYKIEAYEVNEKTIITDLQIMIAQSDECLPVTRQILTDYHGKILAENQKPLLSRIKKPVLFVFKKNTTSTESIPEPDVPLEIRRMIELPRSKIEIETLQDHYRITLFFIKQQIYLFKLYIFAVTIKADLLIERVKVFYERITKSLVSINSLTDVLSEIRAKSKKEGSVKNTASLDIYDAKLKNLVTAANKIKSQFDPPKQESELKRSVEKIECTKQNMLKIYDKAVVLYTMCKNERLYARGAEPVDMVKLVFEFLEAHPMHNANIPEFLKHISSLEKDLVTCERIFNSVTAVTEMYQSKLLDIIGATDSTEDEIKKRLRTIHIPDENQDASNGQTSMGNRQVTDTVHDVIYENLMIRYTLDSLVKEMERCIDLFSR